MMFRGFLGSQGVKSHHLGSFRMVHLGWLFGHLEAIEWMVGRALRQVDY